MVPVVQILADSFCSRLVSLLCPILHPEEIKMIIQRRESIMCFIIPEVSHLSGNLVDKEAKHVKNTRII